MNEQELRAGCCADWPKPCGYHEGYLDAWYARDTRDATADEFAAVAGLDPDSPIVKAMTAPVDES